MAYSMHLLYLTIICPKLVVRLISYFVFFFIINISMTIVDVAGCARIHTTLSRSHIYEEKIADQLMREYIDNSDVWQISFVRCVETSDRNNNHHHHIIHFISVMNMNVCVLAVNAL